MHDWKQVWHDVRVDVGHVSWPQIGQRELQGATDDNKDVVGCQNFQKVVEHGFVLLLGDDTKGHHVDDHTKDGEGQNNLVKHHLS